MKVRIFNKILVYFLVIIMCIVIFPMDNVNASEELGGSCRIVGGMEYGCNVEVNTNDIVTSDSSALLYQWRRNGSDIPGATNYSYNIVADDVGCILTVSVTSSVDNGELIASSADNLPVRKTYSSITMPEPPVISKITHNSIELSKDSILSFEGIYFECEYSLYTEGNEYNWQDSNVFTGLEPNTKYGFVQRTKETNIYYHSDAGMECYATTLSAPAILTHNVINNEKTFNIIKEGYESENIETLNVTITASGTHTNVTASLSSGDKDSFEIIDGNIGDLSDGSKTFSIKPILGLAKGTYTANVMITSTEYTTGTEFIITQVIEEDTVTPTPAKLTHNVTNGEKTLNILKEGYETGTEETLDVIITASGGHSGVTASMKSGDTDSFEIIDGNLGNMNNETKTFSIKPISGLSKGTYTANVMIFSNEYKTGTEFIITQVIEEETAPPTPAILTHNVTNNEKTFNILKEGYETGTEETLNVIITASGDHSGVTASLESGDTDSFEIIHGNLGNLNNETKSFSIKPISGLSKGTYTTNVVIYSIEYTEGIGFTITQEIEEDVTPTPEPTPLPPKKIRNRFTFKVRDENTGDPIKGAILRVGSKKYKTNKSGFAYVMLNKDGDFDYSVTHDDYITEKGIINSPAIYSRSTQRFNVSVKMDDNNGPVYHKCLESELLRGKEIYVNFDNYEITGKIAKEDILIKGNDKLVVEKVNYNKDSLSSIKLKLKDYIIKDIDDIEIFIDSDKIKNVDDNVSTNVFISIINEPNLVLNEKYINNAKIKFVIDGQYFKKNIDKNDIKLIGATSKLKVKEVIYVNEKVIFIKLEKKVDLINTTRGIKIQVKNSGLKNNKSKSMINLGELTILSE